MEQFNLLVDQKRENGQSKDHTNGKNFKKYYTSIEKFFIRKTQAEKRKAWFGKDPLAH